MIDVRSELANFKPIDITELSDDTEYTDTMRIAFTLYNKALNEANAGSYDLARNNLRKAIKQYPEFTDATILLGICVFANGDRVETLKLYNSIRDYSDKLRADKIYERMLKSSNSIPDAPVSTYPTGGKKRSTPIYDDDDDDDDDVVTVRERKVVKTVGSVEKKTAPSSYTSKDRKTYTRQTQQKPAVEKTENEMIREADKKENTYGIFSSFLSKRSNLILLCILLVFVVVSAFLIINLNSENESLKRQISSKATQVPVKTQSVNATPAPGATAEPVSTPEPTEDPTVLLSKKTQDDYNYAVRLFHLRYYVAVIEILNDMDAQYLESAQASERISMLSKAKTEFAGTNHSYVYALDNVSNFQGVIDVMLPIYRYYPEYKKLNEVLYYLGKAYEGLGDKESAKYYYNECISRFTGDEYASYSQYKLSQMQG